MSDILDRLEALADAGRDVYQDIVSAAQNEAADMDARRWQLGDLACLVEKQYGKNTIRQFAKDINQPVKSVQSYRTVSRFFDRKNSTRAEYSDSEGVAWSHFREACRWRKKYKQARQAERIAHAFIEFVAANTLTVEAARLRLNRSLGKPTPPYLHFAGELCSESAGDWIIFRLKGLTP